MVCTDFRFSFFRPLRSLSPLFSAYHSFTFSSSCNRSIPWVSGKCSRTLGVHIAWFTEGIEKNVYRNKQRNLGINCYILHFLKVTQVPAKWATNKLTRRPKQYAFHSAILVYEILYLPCYFLLFTKNTQSNFYRRIVIIIVTNRGWDYHARLAHKHPFL